MLYLADMAISCSKAAVACESSNFQQISKPCSLHHQLLLYAVVLHNLCVHLLVNAGGIPVQTPARPATFQDGPFPLFSKLSWSPFTRGWGASFFHCHCELTYCSELNASWQEATAQNSAADYTVACASTLVMCSLHNCTTAQRQFRAAALRLSDG